MRAEDLFDFIAERHYIYERRAAGAQKPWTKDPILQAYRFCNVYRELDTVTKWIADNWREPHKKSANVWFAMVIARLVNWPDTLAELGEFGVNEMWRPKVFIDVLESRAARGEKVFTGAYMIHAGDTGVSKARYLAAKVLQPMWDRRNHLGPTKYDTLHTYHQKLMAEKDMGSFMAGQIVCDLKYIEPLSKASDWHDWAAPGPGSMRGLNRVYNRQPTCKWKRGEWEQALAELKMEIDEQIHNASMPRLHAQDLQNCLCEFDKYERVRLGEGRPRAKYNGGA